MTGANIHRASTWGLILIAVACFVACAALFGLSGCHPLPDPQEPPAPGPDDDPPVPPEPGPAATDCERACGNAVQLKCSTDMQLCTTACERYETLGGSSSRNPRCQAKATSCEQLEACRGGT